MEFASWEKQYKLFLCCKEICVWRPELGHTDLELELRAPDFWF